jgi:phosphatidylglycerophosphate synthase
LLVVRATGPGPSDFRRVARPDAGVFTHRVDYPVAARFAAVAYRARARPSALTLGNLLLGVGTSIAVIALASRLGSAAVHVAAGIVAWLLWQVAYCLDCADGQLARVSGASSAAGGRLDVLCDIAVQVALVAAVIQVSAAAGPRYSDWLAGVFAASWMVNMVTSVMAKEGTNDSLITSRSAAVQAVKVIRDYGFIVTVIAGVLVVRPAAMLWVMLLFTFVNVGFLTASIVRAAVTAWRPGAPAS